MELNGEEIKGNMLTGMNKPAGDPNLVLTIKNALDLAIGFDIGTRFITNASIKDVMPMISPIQRIIINRYFVNLLYRFRAKSNVEVIDIITCLIDDGENEVWIDMFKKGVLPFLISENVFGVVQD